MVLDRGVSWEQALAKRREASEAGMDEADDNPKSGTRSTPGMTTKVTRSIIAFRQRSPRNCSKQGGSRT